MLINKCFNYRIYLIQCPKRGYDILLEVDIMKELRAKFSLTTNNGCWKQPLDYEGIPFRCHKCFSTVHLAAQSIKQRIDYKATW